MSNTFRNKTCRLLSNKRSAKFFTAFYDLHIVNTHPHAFRRQFHGSRILVWPRVSCSTSPRHQNVQKAPRAAAATQSNHHSRYQKRHYQSQAVTSETSTSDDTTELEWEHDVSGESTIPQSTPVKNHQQDQNGGDTFINSSESSSTTDTKNDPSNIFTVKQRSDLSPCIRTLMRHSAHNIVVVTALADKDSRQISKSARGNAISPNFRGMTVSSFSTVSLDPVPLISFNVKQPSRTLDAIIKLRAFRVHFMAGNTHGAYLANLFAMNGRGGAGVFSMLDSNKKREEFGISANKSSLRGMVPRLSGPGIRAVASCTLLDREMPIVGDHVIVLAKVQSVLEPHEAEKNGLMYTSGEYRLSGARIDEQMRISRNLQPR